MKVRALLIPALVALSIGPAAPARAAGRTVSIEATLAAAEGVGATGTAAFRTNGSDARFIIRTGGLTPGVCEVRIGGSLEALLIVEETGGGELQFDTAQFEKKVTGGAELKDDVFPLTFDPRGRTIEISRVGRILLTANFPARPTAGRP